MSGEPNQVVWRGVRPVDGIRGIWPARNATRVYENERLSEVGSKLIYTVPAGKKLFVCSVFIASSLASGSGVAGMIFVRDGDDAEQFRIMVHNYASASQQSSSGAYVPALEVPAGWDVCIYSWAAAADIYGVIFGWLEDA